MVAGYMSQRAERELQIQKQRIFLYHQAALDTLTVLENLSRRYEPFPGELNEPPTIALELITSLKRSIRSLAEDGATDEATALSIAVRQALIDSDHSDWLFYASFHGPTPGTD